MSGILHWIGENQAWIGWMSVVSVVTFVGTLVAIPILVARIPADYFVRRPVRDWPTRHPAVHVGLVVAKNGAGLILVLAGIAMLVLPGQGLLTILVGVMLLDFPGKRRWERWLVKRPPIRRAVNWIRARRGRPPLTFEP